MTNRTIKIIGQGYNPTPVSVVASVNGNVVHTGTVPTVNEDISVTQQDLDIVKGIQANLITAQTAICSFELDMAYTGNAIVELAVTGGPIWFGTVLGNYIDYTEYNPSLTPEQIAVIEDPATTFVELQQIQIDIASPPFTAEEQALILAQTSYPYPAEVETLVENHNATLTVTTNTGSNFVVLPDLDDLLDVTWSGVVIDGVEQPISPYSYTPPLTGTWWWTVKSAETFEGSLDIVTTIS